MDSSYNPNARFENRRRTAAGNSITPVPPYGSTPMAASVPTSGALATNLYVANHPRGYHQQFPHHPHHPQMPVPLYRMPNSQLTYALAIDCEMVGVGPACESALARVSVVNDRGCCVLDKYVKPKVPVTDYRTRVSGIRPENLVNAASLELVINEVADMLSGRIAVGHAIHHDFKVLFFRHPKHLIRDTSRYFKKANDGKTPSLKNLALRILGSNIQFGEHSSVEDAMTVMRIYLKYRAEWEREISHNSRNRREAECPTPLPPLKTPAVLKPTRSKGFLDQLKAPPPPSTKPKLKALTKPTQNAPSSTN